jgi:hypothetical protein
LRKKPGKAVEPATNVRRVERLLSLVVEPALTTTVEPAPGSLRALAAEK